MSGWIVLRYAAWSIWRAPALSAAVVLTIAAGIGSNVVVQAFVRGLLSVDASSIAPETMDVVDLLRLAGALLFVLTCVNVTLLLLFRTNARSRDAALRVAIGAGRRQLAGQLLAESLILALCGATLALLLGVWTSQLLPALLWAPYAEQLYFDLHLVDLLVSAAVGISIVSLCGLVPLIEVKDRQPAAILQRESAGPSLRAQRLRAWLLVIQTAGTCAFVITAQLLLNRFDAVLQTSLGEVVANPILATVGIQPQGSQAQLKARSSEYFGAVERAAREVTGIGATSWVWRPPGSASITQRFSVEPANAPLVEIVLEVRVIRAGASADGAVSLRAGRPFSAADAAASCRVALLSQDAAGRLFGGEPLGRTVFDADGAPIEIVGVVTPRGSTAKPDMSIYYSEAQRPDAVEGDARFQVPDLHALKTVELDINAAGPDYFARMALPQLAGDLNASGAGGCRRAVVDRMAAEEHFQGDAIGAALIDAVGRRTTITGVVESSRLRHWQRPLLPTVYFPLGQETIARMSLALFPDELSSPVDLGALQEALERVPNGVGGVRVATLEEYLRRSALAPEHISGLLMLWLAATTVGLAALGLHGAIQEAARQRRDEVALRLALGARPRQLMQELSRSALRLAGVGATIGGVVATLPAVSFKGALSESVTTMFWTWLGGMFAPIAIVAIASVLPVYKVLRMDLTGLLRRI